MESNQILFYIVGSMFFMLLFAIGIVSFFYYSQKKITGAKIALQEKELIFQRELLENTVRIQEEERDRIAKDLHDEVASKLNIVHLNMHLLRKIVPDTPQAQEVISYMDTSLKESTQRTRTISHELMPPLLKKFGIHQVLEDLSYSVNATEQLHFELNHNEVLEIKDELKVLHIYRIAQELVNNTLKYAQASQVSLSFEKEKNDITMTYTDNGIGFEPKTRKMGYGLSNIETRIRLLNGTVHWERAAQKGIVVTFKFPNHD
jgi:signal transduction histidine kinase